MSLRNPQTGKPRLLAALLLGAGIVLVAFGGIALAKVSTGGGPGFDVLSAGSATEPPPPVSTPPPTPAPAPAPAPAPTPPALTVAKGPKVVAPGKRVKLTFKSATPGTSFVCRIDKRAFRPCTSPFRLPKLGPGRHMVSVQAVDASGARSSVSKIVFKVEKPVHKKKPAKKHHR